MGGGWLESLEKQLNKKPDIQLYISFYHNEPSEPFKFGNSIFYPVLRKKNILSELKKRGLNRHSNDKSEIPKLLEVITTINPDIIHIHGTEDNFGLLQKFTTIPVVISIQGIINPYSEKFFSGIPKVVAKKNEPLKSRIFLNTQNRRYNKFKSMAIRESEILSISKHLIGRTSWDRRVTSILAKKGKYYQVDEILRDEFYNNRWNNNYYSSKKLKIISLSTNNIYKGFETIIKTALILQNLTNQKISWDIIGLSENDAVVRIMVSWLKINLNHIDIKLHGNLPPDKFIPLMLNSNVYCQASHIENSPNSLCEAMYLGMPVVATFAGGTDSLLENNKEGILVQDGDQYSMAGALVELQNNPEKAKEMGKNARKRAMIRHDKELIVNETINTYKLVLNI